MAKNASIVICVFLLAYFVFTSGLIFEIKKAGNLGSMGIPYSIALSGDRTGLFGIYTKGDVECAKWLGNTEENIRILSDYNGINLVSDYVKGFTRTYPYNIYYHFLAERIIEKSDFYMFLTAWNIKHSKRVIGLGTGMRIYEPLPDVSNMKEVFRSGDSIVYYSSKS